MSNVAESYGALQKLLAERMNGLPKAVNNGQRLVPVSYEVNVTPLVDDEDVTAREREASSREARRAAVVADPLKPSAAFRMYVNAQQSDDGLGVSFMTTTERANASMEWRMRLRDLVRKSDREHQYRERNQVRVDIQDVD